MLNTLKMPPESEHSLCETDNNTDSIRQPMLLCPRGLAFIRESIEIRENHTKMPMEFVSIPFLNRPVPYSFIWFSFVFVRSPQKNQKGRPCKLLRT